MQVPTVEQARKSMQAALDGCAEWEDRFREAAPDLKATAIAGLSLGWFMAGRAGAEYGLARADSGLIRAADDFACKAAYWHQLLAYATPGNVARMNTLEDEVRALQQAFLDRLREAAS